MLNLDSAEPQVVVKSSEESEQSLVSLPVCLPRCMPAHPPLDFDNPVSPPRPPPPQTEGAATGSKLVSGWQGLQAVMENKGPRPGKGGRASLGEEQGGAAGGGAGVVVEGGETGSAASSLGEGCRGL